MRRGEGPSAGSACNDFVLNTALLLRIEPDIFEPARERALWDQPQLAANLSVGVALLA